MRRASIHVRIRNSCTTGIWAGLELSIPEASPRLAGSCDDPIIRAEKPDLGQVFSINVLPTKYDRVRYSCPRLTYQSLWVGDDGSATARAGVRGSGAGIPCWQDPSPGPGVSIENCLSKAIGGCSGKGYRCEERHTISPFDRPPASSHLLESKVPNSRNAWEPKLEDAVFMLAIMTPSYRGAGQDGGLRELRDEVLMMKESPTAHPSSVFAGVVSLHPPDEMICCDMTVPARP